MAARYVLYCSAVKTDPIFWVQSEFGPNFRVQLGRVGIDAAAGAVAENAVGGVWDKYQWSKRYQSAKMLNLKFPVRILFLVTNAFMYVFVPTS